MILGQWGTLGLFGAEISPPEGLDFGIYAATNINYRASGKDLYSGSLQVGKSNTYTLYIGDWLKGDDIDTVTVTAPDFAVGAMGFDNDTFSLGVLITGLTKGRYPIHFSWDTESGRSGCMSGYVNTLEC
jgi:hypothetical protein